MPHHRGAFSNSDSGSRCHPDAAIEATGDALAGALESLKGLSREEVRARRQRKFLAIGRNL